MKRLDLSISLMKLIMLFSIASFTIIVLTQDKVLAQTPTNLSSSDQTYHFVKKWGSSGIGDGQFERPRGIALDSFGNVYVADSNNNRIQKFDSNGTFITKWGSEGTGDGQFQNPSGIALDSSGNVYVADWGNNRVQVFSPSSNG
jgi:tripartite motif-containing protein 71